MEIQSITPELEEKGLRLDKVILNHMPDRSRTEIQKWIKAGQVIVNDNVEKANYKVEEEDVIQVTLPDPQSTEIRPEDIPLDIIYEDDKILIINKPIGIEVTGNNSLTSIVHNLYKTSEFLPMPCHRIDRNTIGLVLFAKNQSSLDILLNKFKSHEIEKHYLALVYGIPKKNFQRCEAYLFKDNKKSQVYISNTMKKGYQKIITTYSVLKRYQNNTSLLDVEIETGKTHQIRAHLAYIGYPIIGDGKYGKNEINKKFGKKYQMLQNYILKFNFKTPSGILEYLNGKSFMIPKSKQLK